MADSFKFSSIEVPTIVVDMPFMAGESDNKNLSVEEYTTEIAKALHDGTISILNEILF